ncbi:MAG TPA: hypothetical protein VI522_03415, partial [Gammaproteobacteria bacterium]|nr:hypothetical protein [Gammaproteobacteria bacterium]
DAPFGFIGIQNNLNPLLESFGRLKAETGSTGAALKALGSSLIGPAGLGIALSVVSAAFLFYQQYVQKANRETENAKKVTDDYAESLDQVSQAQLKGAQSAQSELITLKLLYERTQNLSLSNKQRVQAVNELQDKYPAYFGNLKDEAILAGQAGTKYNELASAILATAKARAATDLIVKNQTRKLEDEQKIIDLQKEQVENEKNLSILKTRSASSQGSAGVGSAGGVGIARELSVIEEKINKNKEAQRNLATDINIIDGKNLQLTKSINAETAKGLVDAGKIEGTKKVTENFRASQLEIERTGNSLDEFLQKYLITESLLNKTPLIPIESFKIQAKIFTTDFERFNDQLNILSNDLIDGSLAGLGSAIGEAMATGTNAFEAGGKALLGSFGGFLTEYGKLLIKYGAAAVLKGKLDLAALIPGAGIPAGIASIAAGVALVAAGAAIGNFASGNNSSSEGVTRPRKIPGFANGVRDFSGGLAVVGERGPELVNLPTGSSVIPNHNLSSFGGGDIVFNVSSRIDQLGNLITAIDRERSRLRRVGA